MNQIPIPQQANPDHEISLIELWQMLVKRRVLMFFCFFAFILAGGGYGQLRAPVFQATITLRIGQVQTGSGPLLLENPQELVARLSGAGGGISAAVARGTNNLVTVTALSGSAEGAAVALEDAVRRVIRAHAEVYSQSIQPIRERIAHIDAKRQALEQESTSLDQSVQQLRGREPVQTSLMVMQRAPLMHSILQLDTERVQLLQQLSPPQTQPTELLGRISSPNHPSQLGTPLILMLAAMLGLVVGFMMLFVMEFVAKVRANIKRT